MSETIVYDGESLIYNLSLLNKKAIAFDTETTSLRQDELEITGISFSDGEHSFYAPIVSSLTPKECNVKITPIKLQIILNNYFSNKDLLIIAHNWVFDARVLAKIGVDISSHKCFDTMVADHLIDENRAHGLKYLVTNILGMPVVKYDEVGDNHYNEEFYKYGLADALNTYLLYTEYNPIMREQFNNLFFNIEMNYQKVLLEMALEGVLIDNDYVNKATKELNKELNEALFQLCRLGNVKYEVLNDDIGTIVPYTESWVTFKRKPSELRRKVFKFSTKTLVPIFKELGIEIKGKTPKGNPSIGKETLDNLMKYNEDTDSYDYSHEFIKYLHKYKKVSQLLNLFFNKMPDFIQSDGKIRSNFKDTGTVTGRLTSSKPNLQQLAKSSSITSVKVRKAFIAPKGYKMFSIDYSGQEVGVAAQISKDPTLVNALNNGYDMHLAVANKSFDLNIPEECLNKKHPEYKSYKKKHSKHRSMAKSITFGLLYGKGSYSFALDFGITEDEAQEMIDNYFSGMPKVKEAIDNSHRLLDNDGYVVTLAGRKRHFGFFSEDDWIIKSKAYRQSFNFMVQSFSADMIRTASVLVFNAKKKYSEWGLKQVMTVHDENVYIVKEEYLSNATTLVKKCFDSISNRFVVNITSDISTGDNYEEAK